MAATTNAGVFEPGKRGTPVQIVTNLSRLELDKNMKYYKYDVSVHEIFKKPDGSKDPRTLPESRAVSHDFLDQRRKRTIVALFQKVLKDQPEHFNGAVYHIYDREAILYTVQLLQFDHDASITIEVTKDGIPDLSENSVGMGLTFKPAFNERTLKHVEVPASAIDEVARAHANESILGVLNLAVSQQAFFDVNNFRSYKNGCHYRIGQLGQKEGFSQSDFPSLNGGKYIAVGVSEAVKVLGDGAFVVTDVKKGAFHSENMSLWDKIFQLFGNQQFNPCNASLDQKALIEKQLKGLFVSTNYKTKSLRTQHVRISALGGSADSIRVTYDGSEVTMTEYYKRHHNIELQHPDCFTVVGRVGYHYPVELLVVGCAQRVNNLQQTPEMVATMIKACAMKPEDRLRQTMFMKKAIGLESSSVRLQEYGLKVVDQLEKVRGRVLPPPKVVYGQEQSAPVQNNCKWMAKDKFVKPAALQTWAVVALVTGRDDCLGQVMDEFMKRFVQRCLMHGMHIQPPGATWMFKEPTKKTIDDVFAEAEKNGCTFLFFMSSDRVILHDYIKYKEVSEQMLTQEVRLSRVRQVIDKNQSQTLDNIAAKTNMKLGGLNHFVQLGTAPNSPENQWINEPTRLIIGFDVMNPAKIANFETSNTDPWVLGWSANCSTHAHKFVGDYVYVKARDSKNVCEALMLVINDILERFYQNREHTVPGHVYAYFNGVSEGNWETIKTEYHAALGVGISAKFAGSPLPKFTLLVCTKSHNERLYNERISGANSAQQNIAPGTVVDTKITSLTSPEFYLNSHSAFQGTAKTPKYTVLADDFSPRMSMDTHQGIAHALCYLHEIVSMTVSVPAPLLVADRCAKRGHAVYKASGRAGPGPMSAEEANKLLTNVARAQALEGSGRSLVNERYNA